MRKFTIKKYILIFTLIILTIFRFYIISGIPIGYSDIRIHDEGLMYKMFLSLISGNYLGTYNYLTLTKGIVYPLFLCICSLSKIPYMYFYTIIYIISVFTLCFSLKKHMSNIFIIVLYIVLLYNPISFSKTTAFNMYRNSLGIIEINFFFSCLISIYNNKDKNKKYFMWFLMGIIISLFIFTRDDYIWVIVVIIGVILYYTGYYLKSKTYKCLLFIPLLLFPIIISTSIQMYLNKKYYNTIYISELKSGYFNKFLLDLLQIDVYYRNDMGDFTEEGLAKALKVSPTLWEVKDELWNLFDDNAGWVHNDNGARYFPNSSPMWAIRKVVYEKKNFKDGIEANNYFKKVYYELEDGYNKGLIKRDKRVLSIFTNKVEPKDYSEIILKTFRIVSYTITYKDTEYGYYVMDNNYKMDKLLHERTSSIRDLEDTINKINIQYDIDVIYKRLFLIISIIGLLCYIFTIIKCIINKKINFLLVLSTISLFLYFEYAFIISLVDTTTNYSMSPYYLNPVYTIQIIFVLISIYNVNNYRFFKKIKS